jgi:hypothetical protein
MARVFFLFVLAAAFLSGVRVANAQALAGTLDCRASVPIAASVLPTSARCVFWPVFGIPTVSTGTIGRPLVVGRSRALLLRTNFRAVWNVFSSGVIVAALTGTYVRPGGGGTSLVGGPGGLITLVPAEDVPGEDLGANRAPTVAQLILQ